MNAPIGEEHEVEAVSADKADGSPQGEPILKAKNLHRVPDEVLEVTPMTAAPGTRITVTASNLPLYTPVNVFIGSVLVAGSSLGELAESDGNGEWEGTPLVPQLTPGTHTVEMRVGRGATGITVSTFLEIADIITRASEEAFSDLIDNGTLTRVWYLEAATQTWSFFDPAPEFADFNTLTEVSTGQIVTIIMATQDDFQGKNPLCWQQQRSNRVGPHLSTTVLNQDTQRKPSRSPGRLPASARGGAPSRHGRTPIP